MQKKIENKNTDAIKVDVARNKVRVAVDSYYDLQDMRIRTGNRLYSSFVGDVVETHEGQAEEQSEEVQKIVSELLKEHRLIADALAEKKTFVGTVIKKHPELKYIKQKFHYELIDSYVQIRETEQQMYKAVTMVVQEHPMWERYFKDVKGIGPLGAALCIAYLDVHKAPYVSSFWSYAGVGTRINPKTGEREAQSRRNLTTRTYVDKDTGEVKECPSLGYNPKLHDWLLGVLPGSVFKTAKDGDLYKCYIDYKNRYANRADLQDAKPMKIHRMACRAMVKYLLRGLWCEWRAYEGYTLSEPYEVQMLGYEPHKYNEAQCRMVERQHQKSVIDV